MLWELVPFARACNFGPSCLVAALLGCSSAAQTVRHEHHVEGTIALEADSYRVRGYDPNDARLVRSLDEIIDALITQHQASLLAELNGPDGA